MSETVVSSDVRVIDSFDHLVGEDGKPIIIDTVNQQFTISEEGTKTFIDYEYLKKKKAKMVRASDHHARILSEATSDGYEIVSTAITDQGIEFPSYGIRIVSVVRKNFSEKGGKKLSFDVLPRLAGKGAEKLIEMIPDFLNLG